MLPKRRLGTSMLQVTDVCLGTMTFGVQNTEEEGHKQLDYAVKERGVNFIDTAEMYPVPSSDPAWKPGRTEEIVGTWIAKNKEWRDKIVVASKVSGYAPCSQTAANRAEPPGENPIPARLDGPSVHAACSASLKRLQTDYIDLYQIHWPDRWVPLWGATAYNPNEERDSVPIKETAQALKELIEEGKIRAYGLSNETSFGVCEWVRIAKELGMPPPASIQNAFSLLNRNFETELAECCAPRNTEIGLLPWSPLCGGLLSGKYTAGWDTAEACAGGPADGRLTKYGPPHGTYQSRWSDPTENTKNAVRAYHKIAESCGLSITMLSLAWCKTRWYCASTIIGATTMEHLKEDIDAFDPAVLPALSDETIEAIDRIHLQCRDPCLYL